MNRTLHGMAFKYRKNGLQHSPDWYESRSTQEPRGGPIVGALKRDMAFLGGEKFDPKMEFTENVGIYRETYGAKKKAGVLGGQRFDQMTNFIYELEEREALAGFKPEAQFKDEPFSTINRLMTEHRINAATMRHFLAWRSRQVGVEKRQLTQAEQEERRRRDELLQRFKRKGPASKFFGYEGKSEPPTVEQEPQE